MGAIEGSVSTAPSPPYVGRFAPSPTGPLHFGSLVAAVASYADARLHNGRWLIRIEDVDTTRCSPAAERVILDQLAAYGFASDGAIVRQSERSALYAAALDTLMAARQVYACACTRSQLAGATRNDDGETIYPGTCRTRALPLSGHALRIRVPAPGLDEIVFNDRLLGSLRQSLVREVGDFVLRRADGVFSYQLAVVVDDHLQGVTQVVRGADLLGNTPRQCYLQSCLGYARPGYLHIPLARNARGEKLSKQTRALAIATDNVVPTLHQAWRFLGQQPLPDARTVTRFWRDAAATWQPERITLLSARSADETYN